MTTTPNDSALLHAAPYDAAKAREYYLRTRHLKGRRRAAVVVPIGRRPAAKVALGKKVAHPKKAHHKKTSKELRAEAKARVAAIQKRLDRLNKILAALVKEAKGRSGVTADTKTEAAKETASKNSDKKGDKPLTAKEKREAAKRAKEAYEKEKKGPAAQSAHDLELKIIEVQTKIKAIRADLHKAAQKAHKKSETKAGSHAHKTSQSKPAAKLNKQAQPKTAPKGR